MLLVRAWPVARSRHAAARAGARPLPPRPIGPHLDRRPYLSAVSSVKGASCPRFDVTANDAGRARAQRRAGVAFPFHLEPWFVPAARAECSACLGVNNKAEADSTRHVDADA